MFSRGPPFWPPGLAVARTLERVLRAVPSPVALPTSAQRDVRRCIVSAGAASLIPCAGGSPRGPCRPSPLPTAPRPPSVILAVWGVVFGAWLLALSSGAPAPRRESCACPCGCRASRPAAHPEWRVRVAWQMTCTPHLPLPVRPRAPCTWEPGTRLGFFPASFGRRRTHSPRARHSCFASLGVPPVGGPVGVPWDCVPRG